MQPLKHRRPGSAQSDAARAPARQYSHDNDALSFAGMGGNSVPANTIARLVWLPKLNITVKFFRPLRSNFSVLPSTFVEC